MNLRSILVISALLLFISVPVRADSVKFKANFHSDAIHVSNSWNSSQFGRSDIKFLGGFKSEDPRHKDFFSFKEGRFILFVPYDGDGSKGSNGNGSTSDPVGTPEPGSLALLLVGLLGVGAFAYRRNPALLSAN